MMNLLKLHCNGVLLGAFSWVLPFDFFSHCPRKEGFPGLILVNSLLLMVVGVRAFVAVASYVVRSFFQRIATFMKIKQRHEPLVHTVP